MLSHRVRIRTRLLTYSGIDILVSAKNVFIEKMSDIMLLHNFKTSSIQPIVNTRVALILVRF